MSSTPEDKNADEANDPIFPVIRDLALVDMACTLTHRTSADIGIE
jgi:hypothetical protein